MGMQLLPKPVKALRGVRVGSIAAACFRSYAVADTGELWAWGADDDDNVPLGHDSGELSLPKPIESLHGIRVDAVVAAEEHTLAWADDGSVYAWGSAHAVWFGQLGLSASTSDSYPASPTPQRISALHVACEV
jgi:alpha-tubulin suppressor-like RCC1 family protein